jgi:uncharacterized protein HemX
VSKLIAIINVVAWSGFWAFGYLALTSEAANAAQMTTAAILAALGAGVGLWAYFQLVKHAEETGYAKRPNRALPSDQEENGETA